MLHRRCPMGVFSHDEAFYYYGLTDREPLVHTLTIYSGYNVHRLKEDGYKVYTVKKELLDVGKQIVKAIREMKFLCTIWNGQFATWCGVEVL
mgnify:FL=1